MSSWYGVGSGTSQLNFANTISGSRERKNNTSICELKSHFKPRCQCSSMSSNSISSLSAHAGEENDSSAWADHALATLGRGAMSVSELQQSAAAMVKECGGNCSSMTRAIAQLDCHGRYPANCERDLFRLLDLPIASSHLLGGYFDFNLLI